MKYVTEYRSAELLRTLRERILRVATRPWTLMEVCGGQTHAILRYGLDELLAPAIELLHGPGCPVCVTPIALVDRACALAEDPSVMLCSFGDMLRVPGSNNDLLSLRARGADVRVIYSPLDAVELAARTPNKQVVLFAIGFETTAPANATALLLAARRGLANFTVLSSQVLVPPAVAAILEAPDNRIQGLLGPGHVCSVVGALDYQRIHECYGLPVVITGFEPVDLLQGILCCVEQLEASQSRMEIQYARAVTVSGNASAQAAVARAFEVCDRDWRGIGSIARSGLRPAAEFADFDAERRFHLELLPELEHPSCISGQVLTGARRPTECQAFGVDCTPERPLGATMVSGEGACAAYFHNQRRRVA